MRTRLLSRLAFLVLPLLVTGCGTPAAFNHPHAAGYSTSGVEQCAPYARRISGIRLYGDADGWWAKAQGRYREGTRPEPGAVLVLKRTARLRSGHVAVVLSVLGPRAIDVTHSNWGDNARKRHIVYDRMLAQDVSPANDWSQVRFWNDARGALGYVYPAYGFIYP